MELMMSVWEPAVAQVHKDVASMQKIVDAEEEILKFLLGIIVIIRRKFEKKNDLDQNVVKEYLQLENLREGMFWVGELFDLQFKQITNVPVYHADVRFGKFQIKRREISGLWYFDPYARKGKRSGVDERI
jgi:peptidyl-dipeptidase Dcp